MSDRVTPQSKAIDHYTGRAKGYDSAADGWHIELGLDFARWTNPSPGSACLDLACGTGLVAIPLAEAVGPKGVVIGIDITSAMLDEARAKTQLQKSSLLWIEHDITQLDDVKEVQDVIRDKGGFDLISCCSAFVLLPDPIAVIKSWSKLLKPGGRLIIDVPTEDKTLEYMFTMMLTKELGQQITFDRGWIHDVHSLENLYRDAGLVVERSFRTKSYMPEQTYTSDQMRDCFDQQAGNLYQGLVKGREWSDAYEAWERVWQQAVNENGAVKNARVLYIVIGYKA